MYHKYSFVSPYEPYVNIREDKPKLAIRATAFLSNTVHLFFTPRDCFLEFLGDEKACSGCLLLKYPCVARICFGVGNRSSAYYLAGEVERRHDMKV